MKITDVKTNFQVFEWLNYRAAKNRSAKNLKAKVPYSKISQREYYNSCSEASDYGHKFRNLIRDIIKKSLPFQEFVV